METRRRLSDQIILAHKQACEEGRKEVAALLMEALEMDLSAIGGEHPEHRKATAQIEAAFTLQDEAFEN
jgi:hypothetical protein